MISPLDPIVPFDFDAGEPEAQLEAMRRIRRDYGIRRFLVTAPGSGVHLTGYPDMDVYRKIGATIKELNDRLAGDDILAGWWCAPSLRSGNAPYQHITAPSGALRPYAMCPLDRDFAADLAGKIATVAAIARPFMIQFEDDFELFDSTTAGCFCPAHLERFAARTGCFRSREELAELFAAVTPESIALRREWAAMNRDTLAGFAARIRAEVDKVAPETRLCQCQPGTTDMDGFTSPAVARALAGPRTRPAVRIYGSCYCSTDSGRDIPAMLFHAMYSAAHLPEDFELFHETDTYPHSRYFASARFVECLLTCAFAAGADDSLFYATQYLDHPLEDRGYLEMFARNRKRFDAYRAALTGCRPGGCEIVSRPDAVCALPIVHDRTPWLPPVGAILLGRLGIPFTVYSGAVKLLAGAVAETMSDEELAVLLQANVLLDAEAALTVDRRGFGALLGVKVETLAAAPYSCERIRESIGCDDLPGRDIYLLAYQAVEAAGKFVKLTPDGAEVLTDYRSPDGKIVQPGFTRFRNRLGGRVAVMACSLAGNENSTMFCYRKKELIRRTLEWLGGASALPAVWLDAPNVSLGWNQTPDGKNAVMTLINFCSDPVEGARIAPAPEWRGATVRELDADGVWRDTTVQNRETEMVLPGAIQSMQPRIFRLAAP